MGLRPLVQRPSTLSGYARYRELACQLRHAVSDFLGDALITDVGHRADDELEYEVGRKSVTGNTDRFTLLFQKPDAL